MPSQSGSRGVRTSNSTKRGKYVSKACEPCRQRRAKCDGARPSCLSCVKKTINCQYSTVSDGRKPASKSYVQLLRDRIEVLECILRAHSIDVDKAVAQHRAEQAGLSARQADVDTPSSTKFEELCAAFEGTLSLDESVTFDGDGECHYFGPTSGRLDFQHLHGTSQHPQVFLRGHSDGVNEVIVLPDSHVSLPATFLSHIDEDLQAELIDLYFIWQNPWFPVLNEHLFREHLQQSSGRYFSPLLLTCVLAAGSRFSKRIEIRTDPLDPDTAGDQLVTEAELLLHFDLKSPTLTTIQAVAIMIYLYIARGADAVAWLHQGTAHRLALDMGLNFDGTFGLGSMSAEEVGLRRQIYWALYCTDKLHATYSGRVCTMLKVQGAVKLPCPSTNGDDSSDMGVRTYRTAVLLRAHATQNQLLESILLGLYVPQPSHTGPHRESFFNSTLIELQNWLYDLPDTLRLEVGGRANTFPQAYTLHMTFHTAVILLANGVLASKARGKSSSSEGFSLLDKKASCACYDAATNMCAVARAYRKTFGDFCLSAVSATHCLLSAALVLMQVASTEPESPCGRAAATNVDLCLQSLKELSVSWKIADKTQSNLALLRERKLGRTRGPHSLTGNHNNPALPELADSTAFSLTNATLLNNSHSFFDSYPGDQSGFDVATQLVGIDFQDQLLWGNFNEDFTRGQGF